jgi:MFS transporter, SP family, sugar:H+ symporter
MFAAGVVFNFGVILQTASTHQPIFIAGRFFAGLGVGLVSAISRFLKTCGSQNGFLQLF